MQKFSVAELSPKTLARLKAWPVGVLALIGLIEVIRPVMDWAYSSSFPFSQRGLGAFVTLVLDGIGLALVALIFLLIVAVTLAAAEKLEEDAA